MKRKKLKLKKNIKASIIIILINIILYYFTKNYGYIATQNTIKAYIIIYSYITIIFNNFILILINE